MAKIILTTNDNWGLLYKFVDDKDNKDKQKLFKAFGVKWENIVEQINEYDELIINEKQIELNFLEKELHIPDSLPYVMANLFQSDIKNERGFSLGVEAHPSEFYDDLFELFSDNDGNVYSTDESDYWSGTVFGDKVEGYGSFTAYFKPGGFEWEINWYSEEDETWNDV
tara:strand:+ start:64 stop:567 length:504 start_codon:yes stop_codon:yes gene_type:complete